MLAENVAQWTQQWLEEGRQEGRQEGLQKAAIALEQRGLSIVEIAQALDLSESKVQRMLGKL